ncbi:hypothetical protein [Cryobacterium sp. TMB1-7]|uniref:hypothetical protein n=1 Tax=Cryobacterium sp. TMB1-7 TaxID=2555866 RepID=UPI00106971AF|nr:hypothetical protein [Cryobacterium sp. TMB1-7]TFC60024.1 hypothetical protein E3O60_08090 [Cryobacterium sp. TMB1-7]
MNEPTPTIHDVIHTVFGGAFDESTGIRRRRVQQDEQDLRAARRRPRVLAKMSVQDREHLERVIGRVTDHPSSTGPRSRAGSRRSTPASSG